MKAIDKGKNNRLESNIQRSGNIISSGQKGMNIL